ncbi:phosphatase PAP2 family protein [Hymenobacter koreensis]|uniref:Phosphatidic acid phosphatase type 2/haloperoxidase domain-containing protein n=1 Tax=Hymenobacter koreensis TaxID=1084523 RepID=A0ABP8IXN9_9BACT
MQPLRLLAQGLSVVLHPLAVPTYLVALLAFGLPAGVLGLAASARGPLVGWVALFTFVLPALGTLLLVWLGVVNSVELADRRQRPLPLTLAGMGFLAATLAVRFTPRFHHALLVQVLAGITLALLCTLLITFWWKISAHAVGMGGAVGLLLLLQEELFPTQTAVAGWAAAATMLALAVAWARLWLRAHTPAQVAAGFALGIGAALAGKAVL